MLDSCGAIRINCQIATSDILLTDLYPAMITKRFGGTGCSCVIFGWFFLLPFASFAQEEASYDKAPEDIRIYRTPEERREAGLKYQVTDWLTVSGLAELEYTFERFSLTESSSHTHEDDFSKSLQFGAEITPTSWLTGELVYEYDDEGSGSHTLDEATASIEAGDFELVAGKQYVPFGVYYSHFVSGPVLEFGETRDKGFTFSWGPDDRLDFSAFTYKGRAEREGTSGNEWDWGLATEVSPVAWGTFGASYLSDLADSQDGLLSDFNDRYERRVPAWSAYGIVGFDRFEVTAELVRALRSFKELDPEANRPRAWNLELAYYPAGSFEWALRLEGSKEVEDEPELRAGMSVAWRIFKQASITLEYLRGTYEQGLAEDSKERELDKVHQFGSQLSVEF